MFDERKKELKDIGDSWNDGPCRICKCTMTPDHEMKEICTLTECPNLNEVADYQEYELITNPVYGECCPEIKRKACKFNSKVYQKGEKWHPGNDYCHLIECAEHNLNGVDKVNRMTTCDTKCEFGWEYVPSTSESKECCGACQPVACVVNDELYKIGKKWSSPDYCINYICLEANGTVQVQSTLIQCPAIPQDLSDNFAIKETSIPGECCKKHTTVACKVGNKKYNIGETWPSPDGDKCKNVTCVQNSYGELVKQDYIQTCNKDCPKGWEYKESQTQCCGECVQVACVVEDILYEVGEKWTSPDFCLKYMCKNSEGSIQIESKKIECPSIPKDILENFVIETYPIPGECCKKHVSKACKLDDYVYQVGETWPSPDGDKCKTITCIQNVNGELNKQEQVQTCNRNCTKGWEYKESDTECCGECEQVACVVDGDLYKIGEKWSSPDYCIHYMCADMNGTIQVKSEQITCPVIPVDIEKNFIVKTSPIPGECCKKHTTIKCKVGDAKYDVGETWPSPDGDKCKTVTCIENSIGELAKLEHVQTCNTNCSLGWIYQESETQCCGECVQFACIFEDYLYKVDDEWASLDFCIHYKCVHNEGTFYVQSDRVHCPQPPNDTITNFEIETSDVPGECCKKHIPVACKVDEVIYKVGETWPSPDGDKCKTITCIQNKDGTILKQEHIQTCNQNCTKGWEYKESETQCCGECVQVACVFEGNVYSIGEKWSSPDYCIQYFCADIDGSIQVQSDKINCPVLANDVIENFAIETSPVPGECCKKHTKVACKIGKTEYQVGQTFPSPDGDKCKTFTCIKNNFGEMAKQEHIETCNKKCKQGWEYKESETKCCGECIQVACVVDEEIKQPGQNWTSPDGCTTFSCEKSYDQFTVASMLETCPNIEDCPIEDVYTQGCCQLCNYTRMALVNCIPQEMSPDKTVGIISAQRAAHGNCINKEPIKGLTECVGSCSSSTMFNFEMSAHQSVCTCCQVMQYESLIVPLECEDGYIYKKQIPVPSVCGCQGCNGQRSSQKGISIKSVKG